MMIPVRVPAGTRPVLASERRMTIAADHPLAPVNCPACDQPLGPVDGPAAPVVLVFAGIARKDAGYTTGGAVAVHEACAGVTS